MKFNKYFLNYDKKWQKRSLTVTSPINSGIDHE